MCLARAPSISTLCARMTDDPTVFPWSNWVALCGMREDPLLTLHPTRHALGKTNLSRREVYRALLRDALNDENLAAIRARLQQQCIFCRDEFRALVEAATKRFAGVRPAHRPARVISKIRK